MRPCLAALVGLFVLPALHAQPSPRAGPYGVFGNASPERMLFPSGTDPVVSAGWQVSPRVDVHAGYRGTSRTFLSPTGQEPADFIDRSRSRTGTVSAGYTAPLGRARAEVRGSLALQGYRRTRETAPMGPPQGGEEVQETSRYLHTGASALVSIPLGSERGGVAPGVGLALAGSPRLSGANLGRGTSGMLFAHLPVSVRAGDWATVGVSLTGGVRRRFAPDSPLQVWSPEIDIGVRVGL